MLLLFLFIGIIGVECIIYYIIPSDLTGNPAGGNKDIISIFFGLVLTYFIVWGWCVCKKTYSKECSDLQWSKFSIVLLNFVFQISWFFVLSYFRNRISFILSGIITSVSYILPILRIFEISSENAKICFLIVTLIQVGIIIWVSIEFIIYEKFITYGWIIAYYTYPIYLGVFAALFVKFLRIEEVDAENTTSA
jgi:hypothetical protein